MMAAAFPCEGACLGPGGGAPYVWAGGGPQLDLRPLLEGVAGADVLQLLGDLGRRAVQLLGDALLFVGVHAVELLAQVTVDHVLRTEKTGLQLIVCDSGMCTRRIRADERTPTLTGK